MCMGTQRVQMKLVLPWLVRWARYTNQHGIPHHSAVQNTADFRDHFLSAFRFETVELTLPPSRDPVFL